MKKGMEPKIISKDDLEPLKHLTNKQIAEKLGQSVYVVKNSLAHHGMYKGKVYSKTCPACQQTFSSFLDSITYCSNTCKHNKQKIWNRGLTKTDSSILEQSSRQMLGNKLGSLVNHSSRDLEEIELPKSKLKIKFDKKSLLEKEWLLQIDDQPGLVELKRSSLKLAYTNTLNQTANYYPDFEITWETGLRWLVEIKGILTDDDYNKMSDVKNWCKENGFQYRLITSGMVKTNTWNTVFSHPKTIKVPTVEWVMMSHAASWRVCSASPRLQVGAVICSENMQEIESYGYNGDEKGGANCPTNSLPGQDGFIHAEENALLKLKTKEPVKMFVTDAPCLNCAKRIINSGNVKEVYYLRKYRDMSGVGLLSTSGIRTYHFQIVDYKGRTYTDQEALRQLTPVGQEDYNFEV